MQGDSQTLHRSPKVPASVRNQKDHVKRCHGGPSLTVCQSWRKATVMAVFERVGRSAKSPATEENGLDVMTSDDLN